MTYIYDVLLNFTDNSRTIEFFEWEENDILEHVKKIPLIRISSQALFELNNYNVKVDKSFLDRIKGLTSLYKKTKNLEYSVLISDLNRVIGLEFNNKGEIISRSSLLLDEEEEIIEESSDLKEETIAYTIKEKTNPDQFLTRSESKKKHYLLKEMKLIYEEQEIDKLTYLYEELYKKDDLSFKDKYLRIKTDLEQNYSSIHNTLYDIVRLTYMKK